MGDTGALVIGMTLAIMAINFLESNDKLPSEEYQFIGPIGTVVCYHHPIDRYPARSLFSGSQKNNHPLSRIRVISTMPSCVLD